MYGPFKAAIAEVINIIFQTGAFAEIQDLVKRSLQVVVCMLHGIELSLKSVFKYYGIETTGKNKPEAKGICCLHTFYSNFI
jgi:hypothetical protein